jgi:Arc/MetJ family transcription regulator
MYRFGLSTKREAVNFALKHLALDALASCSELRIHRPIA